MSRNLIQEGYQALRESALGLTALSGLAGAGAYAGDKLFNKLASTYKVDDDLTIVTGPLSGRYTDIGFRASNKAPAGSDYSAVRQNASLNAMRRDKALTTALGAAAVPTLAYAGYKYLKNRRKKGRR